MRALILMIFAMMGAACEDDSPRPDPQCPLADECELQLNLCYNTCKPSDALTNCLSVAEICAGDAGTVSHGDPTNAISLYSGHA